MDTRPGEKETSTERPATAQLSIPRDICEWAAADDVIAWVREELAAMRAGVKPGAPLSGALAEPMLPVLAFAYARGIFDCQEIEQLCHSNAQFQELSKGVAISSSELKAFRHKDRGPLVKLIRQVLIKAARQKFGNAGPVLPPSLGRLIQDSAVERLDSARHIDRGDEV